MSEDPSGLGTITLAIPTFGYARDGFGAERTVDEAFLEGFCQDLADAFSRHHLISAHPVYYRAPGAGGAAGQQVMLFQDLPGEGLLQHLLSESAEYALSGGFVWGEYEIAIDLELRDRRARRVFSRGYRILASEFASARHIIVGDIVEQLHGPDADFVAELAARASQSGDAYRCFCAAKGLSDAEARSRLEGALQADPYYDEAAVLLAHSLIVAGGRESARNLLEGVVRRNPQDRDALLQLGNLTAEAGEIGRARSLMEQACALSPRDGFPIFFLGLLLERIGELSDALDCYKEAARRGVADSLLFHRLARSADAAGHGHEAVAHWERARMLAPEDCEIALSLARAYIKGGRRDRALEAARAAAELEPRQGAGLALYCRLLNRSGRYEACLKAAGYRPSAAEVLEERAFALIQLGERRTGALALADVLELDGDGAAGRRALTRLQQLDLMADYPLEASIVEILGHLETDEPGDALQVAQLLRKIYPGQIEPRYLGARALSRLGRSAEAMLWLERLLEEEPTHRGALSELVRLASETAGMDRALSVLQRARRYKPGDPDLCCQVALCMMHLGRLARARNLLHEVLAAHPSHETAGWYLRLVSQRGQRDRLPTRSGRNRGKTDS